MRIHTQKFKELLGQYWPELPAEIVKNRLLRDFFETLGTIYDRHVVDLALILIREVKGAVKAGYKLDYFYPTRDVIEEARGLGAGIVIPHPSNSRPVLLAD